MDFRENGLEGVTSRDFGLQILFLHCADINFFSRRYVVIIPLGGRHIIPEIPIEFGCQNPANPIQSHHRYIPSLPRPNRETATTSSIDQPVINYARPIRGIKPEIRITIIAKTPGPFSVGIKKTLCEVDHVSGDFGKGRPQRSA